MALPHPVFKGVGERVDMAQENFQVRTRITHAVNASAGGEGRETGTNTHTDRNTERESTCEPSQS